MLFRLSVLAIIVWVTLFVTSGTFAARTQEESSSTQLVKDPESLKGEVELKVESGLVKYGPWALFGVIMLAGVGIPISEELLIIPAGFLLERGMLPLWSTIVAVWLGVVLADTIWMLLVRRFSYKLLGIRFFRRTFHPRRLLEIKRMLDSHGAWVIIMGRVLPAARTPTITAAGLAHMPLGPFLIGECIGATKSIGWQLFVGWLIAKGLGDSIYDRHVRDAALIGVGVLLAILIAWWIRRRRKTSKRHRPRAKMRWLREACRPPSERSTNSP
ncbi:MAG TPA: DedA family protein [Phycisphaerales bacterium]|jgi:membrane protein DedA with SNARE-associated domain|nr:DedA family protein [Phycisphaerales bacterium]|tara:strand:+ start:216 stop:1031 length:816 start_codon:yes stop_codon:yes gene_type:complete